LEGKGIAIKVIYYRRRGRLAPGDPPPEVERKAVRDEGGCVPNYIKISSLDMFKREAQSSEHGRTRQEGNGRGLRQGICGIGKGEGTKRRIPSCTEIGRGGV